MADKPVVQGSREQVAFELMAFIARNFEPDPYDVRDFTLQLYKECLHATRSAETGHSVALDLVKAIAISGKDPRRGTKPDRKYVLTLYEECLRTVHSSHEASGPATTVHGQDSHERSSPGKTVYEPGSHDRSNPGKTVYEPNSHHRSGPTKR